MSNTVKWQNNFENALEIAKREKKFIVLDFFNPH